MVIIETPALTVRLDGAGDLVAIALRTWREVYADLQQSAAAQRPEIRGGSVSGFQLEQATEALTERLPGGWVH